VSREKAATSGGRAGARGVALALACGLAAIAAASEPGAIVARRTAQHVELDGRLDEPAWRDATPFSAFVESFPRPGAPPSVRTEVRVLYDDETLYVGVDCSDPEPWAILRPLARRDGTPVADRIEVAIASGGDGRTAYDFIVNAAGVQRDQLLYGDVNATDSWDAVWDAAVSVHARGWSAEIAIPFRQLRFSAAPEQRWGFVVRRYVPRTHQVLDSTLVPREANPVNVGELVVSRLGRLEGLVDVRPRRAIELLPYVAARATLRPQFSDPARPHPRLLDPGLDLGLDFKTSLARRLTLTGTVNPDFAQVESDQVIQNLSTAEQFFPEKRPFFLEGLEIFQPVGVEYGSQQQLFYSRRIGLDAPILTALKVTGAALPRLHVGLLDSVVMGAGNASLVPIGYTAPDPGSLAPFEERPDRRWRFRPSQPFHLGPEDALPAAHPVTRNYFAGVARYRLESGATAGAILTAATPLAPRCVRGEFPSDADFAAASCGASGANVLGLDLNVPGAWGGFAQVEASQAVGGPAGGRVLRDATVLRAGDLGFGGHLRAGKLGGEPFRFDVTYVWQDPKLDLNQVGFQPFSNYQWTDLDLHWVRPSGFGPFHAFQLDYNLDVNWSADGHALPRGLNTNVYSKLQLPGYQSVGARVALEIPQYDTREIAFAGVPFERVGALIYTLYLETDPTGRLAGTADVFVTRPLRRGAYRPATGFGWDLSVTWRPHARLETKIDAAYGHKPQGPRWVETLAGGTAVFGDEDPRFLSVTLRQGLVFTPRLTAQLYAQLFTSSIRFGPTFRGASILGRRHLDVVDLEPVAYGTPQGSHEGVVNVNAVLRWEYRLGSTIFLVYTRSQAELPGAPGATAAGVGPSRLLAGPTTETVLVKWSYWWER
jgi:hypothetical protein